MRAMGGLEQKKEEMRDMRRMHWLADFLDDLRYASRSLRRTSGFAAFVVLTLALMRLVMGKGLVLVGIGTVFGLAMGFAIEHLMNSMLFNAGGVDIAA
jgi:hypothetical protein